MAVGLFVYFAGLGAPAVSAPTWQPAKVPPKAGFPRPWEAGIQVSTYSTANTSNRNLITAIPIIGWSGVGPDIEMVLYHNSTSMDSDLDLTHGMGFDLGPGWTCSYSAQLVVHNDAITITAIADDGTQDEYTKDGDTWLSPPGVFDVLTFDGDHWYLTHKDQSYHRFNGDGKLIRVVDATGQAVAVMRNQSSLWRVTDAAGRSLDFGYLIDRLSMITDPKEPWEDPDDIQDRWWSFDYDDQDRLSKITDPVGNEIAITYDGHGRIATLTDNRAPDEPAHTYVYTYGGGSAITSVTDPQGAGGEPRVQTFTPFRGGTRYTDRFGKDWTYHYNDAGTLSGFTNPLGHQWTFEHDADRNLTAYRDPLEHEWVYTYDDRGNMLSVTDPLGHAQTWGYDGLNNLTSYTDALNNVWSFRYEHPVYPTLLTHVDEPPAEDGGEIGTTELTYYHNEEPHAEGMLESVRDANGVLTLFKYDYWGQLRYYAEGEEPGKRGWAGRSGMTMEQRYVTDSASRTLEMHGPSGSGGSASYNPVNRVTSTTCPPMWTEPLEPPAMPSDFPRLPGNAPSLRTADGWMEQAEYDGMGRLEQADFEFQLRIGDNMFDSWVRNYIDDYDELGMITSSAIQTSEPGTVITRAFGYNLDWSAGTYTRVGPDGVETFVQLDDAGRVEYVRRGPIGDPIMMATYSYYADGLVHSVTYGNGTSIWYEYDAARRLTWIRHKGPLGQVLLRLNYEYTERDEVEQLTEYSPESWISTVYFAYDHRGRLTHERRTPGVVESIAYDLTYEYDQGGNRTSKINAENHRKAVYHYDIEDPEFYGSDNNRLMYYETFRTSGRSSPLTKGGYRGVLPDARERAEKVAPRTDGVLLSTTWYYYNDSGNPTRIVTNDADSDHYTATRFKYASNQTAVTYIAGEEWNWDGDPWSEPTDYGVTYAHEFRYDQAKARYLNRELDPVALLDGDFEALSETWSDYDGDEIYGDFAVNVSQRDTATVTNLRSFEPGMARVDPWTSAGSSSTSYYHGNIIETTRLMSDSSGTGVSPVTYTAFGARIDGENPRYGYAGAWGYQAHDECPYLHVGWRYYDPASGRFLQRDPIGINAGLNVYEYVRSSPVGVVDPSGLLSMNRHIAGRNRFPMDRMHPAGPHLGRQMRLRRQRAETFEDAEARMRRLWPTGGRHSWLDDPKKVKKVQFPLKVGGTCALWLTPYGPVLKYIHRLLIIGGWAQEGIEVYDLL